MEDLLGPIIAFSITLTFSILCWSVVHMHWVGASIAFALLSAQVVWVALEIAKGQR